MSDDIPRTREEIYRRIRQSSRDEVVQEEMARFGFWDAVAGPPADPPEEKARLAAVEKEMGELQRELGGLKRKEALQREARKQRMAEARRKRRETKERREAERRARVAAWKAKQAREIGYLGAGVSAGLGRRAGDEARLRAQGLPVLMDAAAIATAMGVAVGALRFLAFSREVSRVNHYVRFRVPKKAGGERVISAPMPRLKAAQRWILAEVLAKPAVHDAAHGFRPGRSIVGNATPHVGADVVINMDLQDFFPSIAYPRVKGLFRALGYSEEAATVFALVCTEPPVDEVAIDGRTWYVAIGKRHVPQGAPTSPAVTNLLCRRLDRRLAGLASRHGFAYTRYADDLTFSAKAPAPGGLAAVLKGARAIIAAEGFTIHPTKTRVLRRGARHEVTGLVVNKHVAVPRTTMRNFRAVLYQIERDGPKGKRWGRGGDVLAAVRGFAHFVRMVDPVKGEPLVARVEQILAAQGWKAPARRRYIAAPAAPEAATVVVMSDADAPRWWK